MNGTARERVDFSSYNQLVQELIHGSVRRHTFSQPELELLFDLQTSRVRKTARPEMLRRYLRALNQHAGKEGTLLRLSLFLEREASGRAPARVA